MIPLDPVVHAVVRFALALLFASAVAHKLRDLAAFTTVLRDYRILPGWATRPGAASLIAAEAIAAASLLLGPLPLGAALACGLLALYALAIGWNLARGRRDIDCGCMGPAGRGRQPLESWLLARNGVLCAAALLLLADATPRALSWIDALSLAGSVAFLTLLWSVIHQLGAIAHAPGRPA